MFRLLFLLMFMLPAVVLCWRVVVTKSRTTWLKLGAGGAVMLTLVGAFVIFDEVPSFDIADWRSDAALAAAVSASAYLLGWALLRRRGNRRHRTVSIFAGIIGLVPAAGAIAATVLFRLD